MNITHEHHGLNDAAMENVDLQDISAFLYVVRHGSFTNAASHLGVSKSSLSRHVAHLEKILDARLLERTTRQLRLTDVGNTDFEQVAAAMLRLDEASAMVRSMQDYPVGHLRVSAPADLSWMLAPMAAAFSRAYPKMSVELVLTQRYVDLLADEIDIAFRAGDLADSSLVARKLITTTHRLYASQTYLESRGCPRDPDELRGHDCVLFRAKRGRKQWKLFGPDGETTVNVSGRLSGNGYDFVASAVSAGAGIGFLPLHDSPLRGPHSNLIPVLSEFRGLRTTLYLVYPSTRFLSTKVKAFRDFSLKWHGRSSEDPRNRV